MALRACCRHHVSKSARWIAGRPRLSLGAASGAHQRQGLQERACSAPRGLKASLACRRDCAGSSTAPSGFRERLAVVVLALRVDFPAEPRHEHRLPPWPLICRGCLAGLPGAAAWRGYNLELGPAAPQATRSLYWRPARHGSLALVITGDSRHMLNMSAVGTAAATFAQTLGAPDGAPERPGLTRA